MWDQYCSDEYGHRCMSAGQNTEIILDRYGLLIHKDRYEAEVNWNMLETLKDKL
jgi:hypothetical protein